MPSKPVDSKRIVFFETNVLAVAHVLLMLSSGMESAVVNQRYHILVADRNPNVRELLRREMAGDSLSVQAVGTGRQLLRILNMDAASLLVIVDPDLPDTDCRTLVNLLSERFPTTPVVVHAFSSEDTDAHRFRHPVVFVEKSATSIERIKKAVADLLQGRSAGGSASPKHFAGG